MRVIVACEESGAVRTAFRLIGHDAWSCDILPARDGHPCHLQMDVLAEIGRFNFTGTDGWDLMIAFPPCDHLAVSGARWFQEKRADGRQQAAIDFFLAMANAPIPRICIENPIGIMSSIYRKPDQIIQPWQFGHGEVKATCLWLKGLPLLRSSHVVSGREPRVWKMAPGPNRKRDRATTFQGIATAMAQQWK